MSIKSCPRKKKKKPGIKLIFFFLICFSVFKTLIVSEVKVFDFDTYFGMVWNLFLEWTPASGNLY